MKYKHVLVNENGWWNIRSLSQKDYTKKKTISFFFFLTLSSLLLLNNGQLPLPFLLTKKPTPYSSFSWAFYSRRMECCLEVWLLVAWAAIMVCGDGGKLAGGVACAQAYKRLALA